MAHVRQSKKFVIDENPYEIEFYLKAHHLKNNAQKLMTIHKQIYALTLELTACSTLTENCISTINSIINQTYSNALCHLTKFERSLYLSRGNKPILNLDEFKPSITLQGRSWNDTCLQVINLNQNYRWETTHIY